MPEGLEPLAVSVLGEALRNAEKHARPTEVRVAITTVDGAFALEVRNDGIAAPTGPSSGGRPAPRRLRVAATRGSAGVRLEAEQWRVRLVLPESGAEGWLSGRAAAEGAHRRRPRCCAVGLQGPARQPAVGRSLRGRLDPEEAIEAAGRLPARCRPRRPLPRRALRRGALRGDPRRLAQTRMLLISGIGWISPRGGADRGRLGLRLQGLERRRGRDGRADGRPRDDRLRPPGGGARDAADRPRARGAHPDRSGATNREIAERLFLSPHTVKEHASRSTASSG